MPDIRNFFAPKGAAAAAPTPPPKKPKESTKGRRTSRKVVDESDEEEPPPKPKVAKSTPKKKSGDGEIKGVETTTSAYFASSNTKPKPAHTTPKADRKSAVKSQTPVRVSPRTKNVAAENESLVKNGTAKSKPKKPTVSYQKYDVNDDGDAYMDDDDDDGDDIFAAESKGTKRKSDDYVEDEDEDEDLPKPKRVAGRKAAPEIKDTPPRRKRKSIKEKSEESEEELPRKKPAPAKPRSAPKAKKAAEPEPKEIQDILENVPTIQAPEPPKGGGAKFDWRKAGAGGGNAAAAPSNPGGAEIPEGEEDCLTGLTFVFTGVLQTISREDGQALVKRYGGKVTGQPSKNTSFVVVGDEAGPSKLKKIKDLKIKSINEEGLFDLIRKLPAHGGTGVGAQKAMEKKAAQEKKAQEEAEKMEQEDRERRRQEELAAKKAAAARGIAATPAAPVAQLWTSKYAPSQLTHICGNKGQVEKIQRWLKEWPKHKKYNFERRGADGMGGARAIIISGPPGIGKTTAAHVAAKLEGYDVIESNASDTRSKRLVEEGLTEVMNNTSLLGFFSGDGKKVDAEKKKIVLIMDEVDGMSAGDRGGVGALAKLCKKTEVPLILICNERKLPKMKPFDYAAFDIKFQRPTVDQVRARIMTICHREGLKMPAQVVDALIEGTNKDIRQIINMISTIKLDQKSMDFSSSKAMTKAWEKHVILKPWDICQKMLGGGLFAPASRTTLNEKIELYFNDHEFSFLMIQENYLRCRPLALSGQKQGSRKMNLKALELFDAAAESISDGDLVDRMIHGPQQHWSLMPTHAVFSTVRPASLVAGSLMGSTFTSWLGNNSKTGKLSRFVREIHSHMRLRCSGDHNEVRQQYLPVLWDQLIKELGVSGKESIDRVIELMDSYFLTRDDFDAIKELGVGPQAEDVISIETSTKSAFTRTYNSMNHPVPFMKASNVVVPKKASKDAPDLEEAIEEEDAGEPSADEAGDQDNELDLKGDKYIKQPKAKGAKKATKKAAKGDDDDDDGAAPKKSRGRGRPAGSKAKGK